MPYKPELMTALKADHSDAARKYMEARDVDAEHAEHYLMRMKVIGKNIEYTQRMMDGTMGRMPLACDAPHTYKPGYASE